MKSTDDSFLELGVASMNSFVYRCFSLVFCMTALGNVNIATQLSCELVLGYDMSGAALEGSSKLAIPPKIL